MVNSELRTRETWRPQFAIQCSRTASNNKEQVVDGELRTRELFRTLDLPFTIYYS